jgi:hypothetical protein
MEGWGFSYTDGVCAFAIGGIIGVVLKHVFFRPDIAPSLEDACAIVVTSTLWPVMIPACAIVTLDGAINGASWRVSVRRTVETKQ